MTERSFPKDLDFASICDGNTMKMISAHAQALGVSKEYVFFPLLAGVAAAMGKATIKVNEEWHEKCAIWCAALGRQGTRRTTMLESIESCIEKGLSNLQEMQSGTTFPHTHIIDDGSSLEIENLIKLRQDHMTNILGLFENLGDLFGSTGSLKMSSKTVNQLKSAYDASRLVKKKASLSLFGFLLPSDVQEMMNKYPFDLSSRILLTCPKQTFYHSKDFKVPMPTNTPSLIKVFEVLTAKHKEAQVYTLLPEAKAMLDQYHDRAMDCMKEVVDNDQKYAMLSKAPGQLVRLSCIMSGLRQALKFVVYHEDVKSGHWRLDLIPEDIEAAKILMDYTIATKVYILDQACSGDFVEDVAEPPAKRTKLFCENPPSVQAARNQSLWWSSVLQEKPATLIATPVQVAQVNPVPEPPSQSTNSFRVPTPSSSMSDYPSPHGMLQGWSQVPNTMPPSVDVMAGTHNFSSISGVIDTNEFWNHFSDDDNVFISQTGGRLKKLLEFSMEFRIAPSTCAQRHLIPPLSRHEMERYETPTKYPVIIAKEFLVRVAKLGFGFVQNVTNNNSKRKSCFFEKYPYDRLSQNSKDLLSRLRISKEAYMACFLPNSVMGEHPVPNHERPTSQSNGLPLFPEGAYVVTPKIEPADSGTLSSDESQI